VAEVRDDGSVNAFNFPVRAPAVTLQSDARERPLDLRELRYFHSVARIGNFGRAARELNIGQPALSRQVSKLEEGLGIQLLVRHGRGAMLTPAGVCLRDRLDTIMHLLASPLDPGATAATQTEALTLAVPAESAALLVAPLVRRFRALWPNLALDIREGDGADIEEWVLHGRVNVAVVQNHAGLPEFVATPILSERLGLVASVRSPIAADTRPLRLRDAVAEPLILPGTQHWIRRRIESAARQHDLRLQPLQQVNSLASTIAMVRSGLGCTILPLTSVHDEVERGTLTFRAISQPCLTSVCAVVRHRQATSAVVAEFAATAADVMTTLVQDNLWPGGRVIGFGPNRRPVTPLGEGPIGTDVPEPAIRSPAI
jgi:LysR family nitrogen assimilation transcriptional regulator